MIIIQIRFPQIWSDPKAAPNADQKKQTVLKDICAKWSKFSEQDASALKSNDDLVTQVVAKYGTEPGSGQA